ncbi:hypothetical protein V499_00530 [Pseudogymnoascus sp. VKM F-103]|nr:hypothetical protein V499_00530 [Pseudogymnoascus sp. VKM F-103]
MISDDENASIDGSIQEALATLDGRIEEDDEIQSRHRRKSQLGVLRFVLLAQRYSRRYSILAAAGSVCYR